MNDVWREKYKQRHKQENKYFNTCTMHIYYFYYKQ